MEKIFGYTAAEWILALIDILDGSAHPKEIHYNTGLSMERCSEISKMYYAVIAGGFPTKEKVEQEITKNSSFGSLGAGDNHERVIDFGSTIRHYRSCVLCSRDTYWRYWSFWIITKNG